MKIQNPLSKLPQLHLPAVLLATFLAAGMCPAFGAGAKSLPGHVPAAVRQLKPKGGLPASTELRLAIGVPLRDPAGLNQFLGELYNPASPNYHRYLTPDEFTARFAATEADYAAVKRFALASGFKITAEHGNRLLLDVTGRAADVERAFHVRLLKYQHPTEAREFFAPDAEPTVDSGLPVADIQGLNDYVRPYPKFVKKAANAMPRAGSSPDGGGEYFGNDFRTAYVPGAILTGAGQSVGVLQFDVSFFTNDIVAYATAAGGGRTNIPVQAVLLDGFDGVPAAGDANTECSLDIEMAMSMAPALSKILVFEGSDGNDILSAMAASNTVKNLSCSWGWGSGPSTTTDAIFQQMSAQGQSFYDAVGDSDAFSSGADADSECPATSPFIMEVGGTTLTASTNTGYASETVWNWGNNQGTCGGYSAYYSIPSWQTNISMTANHGSTTTRNVPDVALTADNVYVISGGVGTATGGGSVGGTSCAAPLWGGFTALMNQQAAANGNAPVGFINPAIYSLAAGGAYTSCFHDITTGNNYTVGETTNFPAVTGYDLCTGLGTPNGLNLVYALAGSPDILGIAPLAGFAATGPVAGPFAGGSQTFTLTNSSSAPLNWSLVNTSAWITVSSTSGTLAAGAQSTVTANLIVATAANLAIGSYADNLLFTNQTTHYTQLRQCTLQVVPPILVTPASGFAAAGPAGGLFTNTAQIFNLTNLSAIPVSWSLINTSSWITLSSTSGGLAAGGQTTVTANLVSAVATNLAPGSYSANVLFSNLATLDVQLRQFTFQVVQPMTLSPASGFTCTGPVGGPFGPLTSQVYQVTNLSAASLAWSLVNTSSWLNVSSAGGTLAGTSQTSFTVSLTATDNTLPYGTYAATIVVTNQYGVSLPLSFLLQAGQLVVNGGFETGDFTGWTLSGGDTSDLFVSTGYAHSGTYFAVLGAYGSLSYLSQTLATTAGSNYVVSLWMANPYSGDTPNEFSVAWNGTSLYDQVNLSSNGWINLQFTVTATGSSSALQIGGRNDPEYLFLDDVSVTQVGTGAPVFTVQPANQTVLAGANVVLSASAIGSPTLVWQWSQNGTNLTDGGNISGSASNELVLASATTNNAGNYQLVVANSFGSITSSVVSVTVLPTGNAQYFSDAGGPLAWNTTTANWGSASGGPYTNLWNAGGDAAFEGAGGSVNVSSVTAESMAFTAPGYTLSGGTITLAGAPVMALINNATIGSVLADSGTGFTTAGSGTLTLTGNNTYTGPTTIASGAVLIGGAGKLGGGTYAGGIINNGAFTYGSSAAQTLSGVISGAGTLTQQGSGALTLSGANSYTGPTVVSSGTLTVGGAGKLGGGTYAANITNNGAITYNSSSAQTLSGTIAGTGTVTQKGSGTLTLSGGNTYSGTTVVAGGTLSGVAGAFGTGTISLNNSSTTLAITSGTVTNTLNDAGVSATLNLTSGLTFGGLFSGSGTITIASTSYVQSRLFTAVGDSGFSGALVAQRGTYNYSGNNANFSGTDFQIVPITLTDTSTYLEFTGTGTTAIKSVSAASGGQFEIGPSTIVNIVSGTFTRGATSSQNVIIEPASGTTSTLTSSGGTLTFNCTSGAMTINNGVSLANYNAAMPLNVVKSGASTLTINGTNYYTGTTTVSAGTLQFGSPGYDILTGVVSGAGTVNFGTGTTLNLGGSGNVASLSVGTPLTLNGASVVYDLLTPASADVIAMTGGKALTLSGTTTVAPSGVVTNGTYTLISGAGSISGTAANLALAATATNSVRGTPTASFTVNSPTVTMTIAGESPTNLIWQGSASGTWDLNTTANWTDSPGGSSDKFFNLDTVTFNDTAAATANGTNITISGPVYPRSVTFNNSSKPFVLNGTAGGIGGSGTLTKSGTAPVYLTNANTYVGGTIISAGTLGVGNGTVGSENVNGLGTGTATVNGGTLLLWTSGSTATWTLPNAIALNGGTVQGKDGYQHLAGPVSVGASGGTISQYWDTKSVWIDGLLSGSGPLTVNSGGGGAYTGVHFSNPLNTYSGTLTVSSDCAMIDNTFALSNAIVSVGAANGLQWGSGVTSIVLGGLSGSGGITNGGNALAVGNNNSTNTYSGVLSGTGTLTKLGTGTFTLSGANTYTGATYVNGGILLVNGSLAAGSVVTVAAGATLGGAGTINAPTTIQSGGTLQPGAGGVSTTSLANNNSLNLAGNALFVLNRANGQNSSRVTGITTATYGGTLTVTNVGAALQAGDSFTLFQAAGYTGGFANLALPTLNAGLVWKTNNLAVNGSLSLAWTNCTLNYAAGANGTLSGNTSQTITYNTSGTAVTAVPNANYHFVNWSDGSTANPRTDANVTSNLSVTANFAINTYTLTYTPAANGTISGTSPQTVNYGGSGTSVTAVPNTGWHFVNWSDGLTANPRTDVNVTSSITVTATFAINTYTLTYTAATNGTISGTSPQTVNYGAGGTSVNAVPNTGYHFVNWSDGSTANPRTDANVTNSLAVTANFAINLYTLAYAAGTNGNLIGATNQTVTYGTNGTPVTAAPNTGYCFTNWSDGQTANPRTDVSVTSNINVVANFAINRYTLTYLAGTNGTISGTTPQTVNYGTNGTAVSAMPSLGYAFVNWSDGCMANPRLDAAVTNNLTVTANFGVNNAPAVIAGAAMSAGGGLTLGGTGGAGQTYILLTASNLPPSAWTPIATNTANTNGVFNFTDPAATNLQQFYRLTTP